MSKSAMAAKGAEMKIMVVDDHALVREGLRHVLQGAAAEVEVLEAGRCNAAFDLVGLHPDIALVLLDINLPDMNGLAALDRFGLRYPDVPVIMLSGMEDPGIMRQCFDRGAAGFLPKSSMSEVLLQAVRLVLAGGTYVPPEMLGTATFPTPAADILNITPRQHDVLQLIVDGLSNKEIARELDLSEQTVKAHVTMILRALQVDTRTQVVVAVTRLGLIPRL
jgi:DNA-binding NarL/FixJ family response regulator